MPPIERSDFPYPLRTVDGEVECVVDSLLATTLDVTGQTNVKDLYVSGNTTIVGGIVDLANIDCLSLLCEGVASIGGLASLNGGLNTTAINCTNITSTGLLNGTNVTLSSLNPSQTVATNALKQLVSVPSTGTGNNVLQNNPTLVNPVLGNASATSISLGTPLDVASGGTGTTARTGTGAYVLQNSPSLVSPNIGAAIGSSLSAGQLVANQATGNSFFVSSTTDSITTASGAAVINGGLGVAKNIIAGGIVQAGGNVYASGGVNGDIVNARNTNNANSPTTGSITTAGGMSTQRDFYVGGQAFISGNLSAANFSGGGIINPANVFNITNTTDSVNPNTGSIQTAGGLGVVKNIDAGGSIQSEVTMNATSTTTGAIRAKLGGISCALDIWAGGNVHANQMFINTLVLNSVTMNFNSGTFVPTFVSPTGNPGFPVTYLTQVGTYQNVGQMTFLQVRIASIPEPFPPGWPANSHVKIGNIPGDYVPRQASLSWGGASSNNWYYEGGNLVGGFPIISEYDSTLGWLTYVYNSLVSDTSRRKVYYIPDSTDGTVVSFSGVAERVSF